MNVDQTKEKYMASPQDIVVGVEYAVIINAERVSGNLNKDVEIYLIIVNLITDLKTDLLLLPELSKKGRLHYHGKLKFNTASSIGEFYLIMYRSQMMY